MKKISLSLIVLFVSTFFISSCGMIGSCSSCGVDKNGEKKVCDGGCDKSESCHEKKEASSDAVTDTKSVETKKSCGCGKK